MPLTLDVEKTLEQPASLQVKRAETSTPMELIQIAVNQGADIDKLQKLFELQIRWEENEARKAYNKDFAAFKAESVAVVKNVIVTDGPLKGKAYADLFGVVSAVTPVLSRHRLSHSWKLTKDETGWIEVTCTIRHELGHSESVSMGSAPDTGPGRNAIQARVSAKTYLERTTLLAATGLAAQGIDNDGASVSPGKQMPDEDFVTFRDNIEAAENETELKKFYMASVDAAEKLGDKQAVRDFAAAKNKRWRELKSGGSL